MFLHIGNGKSIRKKSIIGIFDLDTSTVSQITKNYVNKMQKKGLIDYGDSDLPRSFVVYDNGKEVRASLSRISTSGLKIRAKESITDYTVD